MISDLIHTIPEYDVILLDMKYSIKYIISFRLVRVIIDYYIDNIYIYKRNLI